MCVCVQVWWMRLQIVSLASLCEMLRKPISIAPNCSDCCCRSATVSISSALFYNALFQPCTPCTPCTRALCTGRVQIFHPTFFIPTLWNVTIFDGFLLHYIVFLWFVHTHTFILVSFSLIAIAIIWMVSSRIPRRSHCTLSQTMHTLCTTHSSSGSSCKVQALVFVLPMFDSRIECRSTKRF